MDVPMPFPLAVFLFFLSSATAAAQSYSNITQGTTLTALGSPSSWPSPSGDFAFGFYPLNSSASSLFLLAVWFASTSPNAVVWSANRDAPVPRGSTVQITTDGRLSLENTSGVEVWSAGVSGASFAALLDSGNLVLAADSSSAFLWQSFNVTTDTLLPGQVLAPGSSLRSQLTDSDSSDGRFQLVAQTDGNLVFYPLALPTGNQYVAYWATGTVDSGDNQLVYNVSGSIDFVLSNGTVIGVIPASNLSAQSFYQRARLDPDGVLRRYVYPKNGTAGAKAWAAVAKVPSDICQAPLDPQAENVGSGVCGYNSYCASPSDQSEISCSCPPQYSFIDPEKEYIGCKQDFLQSCDLYDPGEFKLIPIDSVDWPFCDYEHYTNVDEGQCGQYCMEDCFCAVAIFSSGGRECWKKKLPLSHGRKGSNVNRRALIKVPKSNNTSLVLPPGPVTYITNKKKSTRDRVGAVLLGCSGFLNLILIALISAKLFGAHRKRTDQVQTSMSALNLRAFSYKELEEATGGFKEELGRGAFGIVYKGALPSSNALTSVAVKKLDRLLHIDNEKEFTNEVTSIGQTHHKNLVKLIGYCNEGTHRLLVYEYMSKGSLTGFLFGEAKLRWEQRAQVIIGIARGLLYLHEECSTPIIHCDIKPQNVLLDDNFVARISDFGLAKLLKTDQTRTNTGIRGTRGYVAPEWFKSVAVTKKVDVYSFGVMLLEIICCRRNLETEVEEEEGKEPVLVYWAYDCYREGKLDLLLRNDEEAMADLVRVERFVTVAIWCIQEDPSLRPSMLTLTRMLEGAVPISEPPDPSSSAVSSR